jgi:hypothetical protein
MGTYSKYKVLRSNLERGHSFIDLIQQALQSSPADDWLGHPVTFVILQAIEGVIAGTGLAVRDKRWKHPIYQAFSQFSQNSREALLFLTLTGRSRAKRLVPDY